MFCARVGEHKARVTGPGDDGPKWTEEGAPFVLALTGKGRYVDEEARVSSHLKLVHRCAKVQTAN